ncbi:MAG: hypothetical protein GOV15_01430, partial [Candidatus Diapherotrites archaeon]|nr:hypothetical protein [Candidatus Diapherotrites archaeon]
DFDTRYLKELLIKVNDGLGANRSLKKVERILESEWDELADLRTALNVDNDFQVGKENLLDLFSGAGRGRLFDVLREKILVERNLSMGAVTDPTARIQLRNLTLSTDRGWMALQGIERKLMPESIFKEMAKRFRDFRPGYIGIVPLDYNRALREIRTAYNRTLDKMEPDELSRVSETLRNAGSTDDLAVVDDLIEQSRARAIRDDKCNKAADSTFLSFGATEVHDLLLTSPENLAEEHGTTVDNADFFKLLVADAVQDFDLVMPIARNQGKDLATLLTLFKEKVNVLFEDFRSGSEVFTRDNYRNFLDELHVGLDEAPDARPQGRLEELEVDRGELELSPEEEATVSEFRDNADLSDFITIKRVLTTRDPIDRAYILTTSEAHLKSVNELYDKIKKAVLELTVEDDGSLKSAMELRDIESGLANILLRFKRVSLATTSTVENLKDQIASSLDVYRFREAPEVAVDLLSTNFNAKVTELENNNWSGFQDALTMLREELGTIEVRAGRGSPYLGLTRFFEEDLTEEPEVRKLQLGLGNLLTSLLAHPNRPLLNEYCYKALTRLIVTWKPSLESGSRVFDSNTFLENARDEITYAFKVADVFGNSKRFSNQEYIKRVKDALFNKRYANLAEGILT